MNHTNNDIKMHSTAIDKHPIDEVLIDEALVDVVVVVVLIEDAG